MTLQKSIAFVSCAALALVPGRADAQQPEVRIRSFERPGVVAYSLSSANRPVIGVSLSVGALGDTLGLEVQEVTADGPAAKAGIAVGSRLQEINGVSLRISAADAADPLTADAGYRRLQRELGKLKAGDPVSLRVLTGGQSRMVNVTTASAQDLEGGLGARARAPLALARQAMGDRAALGLSIGSAGNARDTLGVFISAVVADGPAEQAGIIEGERIAAINGVDVRVPREDVRDGTAASARVSRFMREVEKASPGDKMTLRVFANGRYRDVVVTAGKASELASAGFMFESGDMPLLRLFEGARVPMLPREPMAPPATPAAPPGISIFERSVPRAAPAAPPALAPRARGRTVRVIY